MNKKVIIPLVTLAITFVVAAAIVIFYRPPTPSIAAYDKSGIKFSYSNSWQISDTQNKDVNTVNLQKTNSSSDITIEVRQLPISYKNYSFEQIVDAVRLKLETDNKDWVNTFSGTTQIGKPAYITRQLLYETNGKNTQLSAMIGESGTKLFIIAMESNRNDFDLVSHDLDIITDSFEIR